MFMDVYICVKYECVLVRARVKALPLNKEAGPGLFIHQHIPLTDAATQLAVYFRGHNNGCGVMNATVTLTLSN